MCYGWVWWLVDFGVIWGFYIDIDLVVVGLLLQVMILVNLQLFVCGKICSFIQQICCKWQVMDVYFLVGVDDFILYVVVCDIEDLCLFVVENFNVDVDVVGIQMFLIFEYLCGVVFIQSGLFSGL